MAEERGLGKGRSSSSSICSFSAWAKAEVGFEAAVGTLGTSSAAGSTLESAPDAAATSTGAVASEIAKVGAATGAATSGTKGSSAGISSALWDLSTATKAAAECWDGVSKESKSPPSLQVTPCNSPTAEWNWDNLALT